MGAIFATGRKSIKPILAGDTGFVTKVHWRMVSNYPEGKKHNAFPEGCFRPSYLLEVPELKEKGVFIDTHGAAPDAIITCGYVYGKRVEKVFL